MSSKSFATVRCIIRLAFLTGIATLFAIKPLPACDTPVYRYAMYRWQPTPYEVYFFQTEPAGEEDQKVQQVIRTKSDLGTMRANVVVLPVDLNEDRELVGVPPDVKRAWLSRAARTTPSYMVVSPLGMEIYSGPLDEAEVAALIESPARSALAKQLEAGKAAVFVLLSCGDQKTDDSAETELKELVAAVASGQISLYTGPQDQFGPGPAQGPQELSPADRRQTPPNEVAYVKISAQDAAERWLVRQLMVVEPDLHELVDQPMVFAVYGRGRVLPPYIGKGINRDNLIDCVQFLTGACSCTVKEQNPGVDLLVRDDWDAAAAAVAERFGSEEGNESQFGVDAFFPDLFMGRGTADIESGKNAPGSVESPAPSTTAEHTAAATTPDRMSAGHADTNPDSSASSEPPETSARQTHVRGDGLEASKDHSLSAQQGDSEIVLVLPKEINAEHSPSTHQGSGGSSMRMLLTVGIGVGIAVFVLIGATFVLFKPR